MIFRKVPFFLLLLAITTSPFFIYKVKWLLGSVPTTGIMQFQGKSLAGALSHEYSVISFVRGRDTVWFKGSDNIFYKEGAIIPVRYQQKDPWDAKVNLFVGIWADTLVYASVPFIILLALFLHPKVVPWRARLRVTRKQPYVLLVE